jgi:hypothetical protein
VRSRRVHLSRVGNRRHHLTACGRNAKLEDLVLAEDAAGVTCLRCRYHMRRVTGRVGRPGGAPGALRAEVEEVEERAEVERYDARAGRLLVVGG